MLTLSTWSKHEIPQVKRCSPVPQNNSHFRCQAQILGHHTCNIVATNQGFTQLPSMFNNSKWSQNSGKVLYLLLLDNYKGYNSGRDKWKNSMGQSTGDRCVYSFHALSRHTTLPAPWCVCQTGSSLNPIASVPFFFFLEVPLRRHDWLKHWPLVTKLNLWSLSPPQSWGWGVPCYWNFQSSNHVVWSF